jgi:hypothetical protein
MQLIEHYEVPSGGVGEIVFSSIPDTFTDLKLVVNARSDVNAGVGGNVLLLGFNTSYANISARVLNGTGSGVSSFTDTAIYVTCSANDYTASTFGNSSVYIPNYLAATAKSVSVDGVGENNATAGRQEIIAGLWNQTAAITSLTLKPINAPTGKILQYSSASLFGILAGSDGIVAVS